MKLPDPDYRCQGVTRTGERCRRYAAWWTPAYELPYYCHQHKESR